MAGCGGGEGSTSVSADAGAAAKSGSPHVKTGNSSLYVKALREFRQAVAAKASYDAYGYAEYFPATQRAAIDAFCFVADQMLKNPEAEAIEDSGQLVQRITSKAETDLKSERNIVAPGPARRAIARLRAVLGLGSLDRGLAQSYVRACYRFIPRADR